MNIICYPNGPFMVNTFLVENESTRTCFIIDPGHDIRKLIQDTASKQLTVEAIIATHGHIDHIEGVNTAINQFSAPFYMNELDQDLLDSASMQARMFGVHDPGKIDGFINLPAEEKMKFAGIECELRHTPGHSPGSISIVCGNAVFAGDTLFNFSIGRTDLPGGDYEQLISGIQNRLFTLPDDTRVLSGHGPETTIGREKKMNPFFR